MVKDAIPRGPAEFITKFNAFLTLRVPSITLEINQRMGSRRQRRGYQNYRKQGCQVEVESKAMKDTKAVSSIHKKLLIEYVSRSSSKLR